MMPAPARVVTAEVGGATAPRNYTVRVVSFRVVRETLGQRATLSNAAEAAALARQLIPDDAREHFGAFLLNAQNRVVAWHEVSTGTLSASLVHPREVFGPALRMLGVASVILVHNHPSGDSAPSQEDIRLTRQLAEGARLLDLRVHDHVILGDGSERYASLAEQGLMT